MKSFILLSSFLFCVLACKPEPTPVSDTQTSREGRAALGAAEDFTPGLLASLNEGGLAKNWAAQNQAAEGLWTDLNRGLVRDGISFVPWQTFYSKEDLQRIFRIAYQRMGIQDRNLRRSFTPQEIASAFSYHDHEQFLQTDWSQSAYERWLEKYRGEGKTDAIPGMNKVLMNRAAAGTILENYRAIELCSRHQSQSMPCKDLRMHFPRGSAFIKTAWRRAQSEGDFRVPWYQTDDLLAQMEAEEWQSQASGIPLSKSALRMETPSLQAFYLVGVHLTVKLDRLWLWTSRWLDRNASDSAYRSCSVMGFEPLASRENGGFEYEVTRVEGLTGFSWCSNPYLETGQHNHKTSCIGCHQHAGTPWTMDDFNQRLATDLHLLQADADIWSRSDQIWSLLNGPEPLASSILQEIDYFDVYDL